MHDFVDNLAPWLICVVPPILKRQRSPRSSHAH
jgi:hypothetical protein